MAPQQGQMKKFDKSSVKEFYDKLQGVIKHKHPIPGIGLIGRVKAFGIQSREEELYLQNIREEAKSCFIDGKTNTPVVNGKINTFVPNNNLPALSFF